MSAAPLPAPHHDDVLADAPDGLRTVCHSPRIRPYERMHDDLRRQLLRLMLQALDLDASEAHKCATFAAMAEHALCRCESHLALEEALFHAPLRARAPRALMAVDLDHEQLQQSLATLRDTLQRLRDARTSDQAEAIARELRLRLSLFVADGLAHMVEEESTLTRAWWAHFSDDEIRACLHAGAQQAPHALG
ncbi:MAG: hypothetical protein A2711_04780 [Burkholderiales bacterium RIFCSPHIGHO2_01_FULL_63_240]|jgi:hypothetical protein|nr:MAG: hypothetical protein A2711_04780 [Burkholderiales bacterium RIFCSPHIGHO2_01_FULL_63_240]